MGTAGVGADCESICGKCGDVWHVVVAKVGDRIAKVQCKQCGGLHRYSPPAALKEKERLAKEAARASGRASSPPRERASRGSREPKPPPGPAVQVDLTRPVRPYRPAETFAVGDRIEHVTFGMGVVEGTPEPGKMFVWFPDQRRTLVMAKGQHAPLLVRQRPAGPTDEG